MRLPLALFLLLLTAFTTSADSIFTKMEKQLPAVKQYAYEHLRELQRLRGHWEKNQYDQKQRQAKYSTLETKETNNKIEIENGTAHQNATFVSRTFGLRRPLKMALPSIMFKLGIITTMLAVLTLLVAKSLIVGLIILVIQVGSGIAKFAIWKKEHKDDENHNPPQNIHVHVHGQQGYKSSYSHRPYISHSPYSDISKSDLMGVNSRNDNDFYQRINYVGVNNRNDDDLYQRMKFMDVNRNDDDLYQRLKDLRELDRLRESLYTQVI